MNVVGRRSLSLVPSWLKDSMEQVSSAVSKIATSSHSRSERELVQAPIDTCYEVVADVESYREFVPWCVDSRLLKKTNNKLRATLTAGFGPLTHTYSSIVTLDEARHRYVLAEAPANDEVFERMRTLWRFEAKSPSQTEVSLESEFKFRSAVNASTLGNHFELVVSSHISAFTNRMRRACYRSMSREEVEAWLESVDCGEEFFKTKDDLRREISDEDCVLQKTEDGRVRRVVRVARVVVKNSSGRVLHEVSQLRNGRTRSRNVSWVGEKMKPLEDFRSGAVRGLKEELGLEVSKNRIKVEFDAKRESKNANSSYGFVDSVYLISSGEVELKEDEIVELVRVEGDLETTWEWR